MNITSTNTEFIKVAALRPNEGQIPEVPANPRYILKARTLESHMSLEHLKEMLTANDLTAVNNIVLIHMSGRNSQQDAFVREIAEHTGKHTMAATKGLTIELNKTPF